MDVLTAADAIECEVVGILLMCREAPNDKTEPGHALWYVAQKAEKIREIVKAMEAEHEKAEAAAS